MRITHFHSSGSFVFTKQKVNNIDYYYNSQALSGGSRATGEGMSDVDPFKADLTKAFDSITWSFLMEVLLHVSFPNTWVNWLAELLRTASTRVFLNGESGRRIFHAWDLHQGDLLSPMLFIHVMEVLGAIFRKADDWELLWPLGV
jgi:hypothetical protein